LRPRVFIPWLIIIAAVAAIALSRQMQYRAMAAARTAGAALPVDELSIELAGRITVGINALTNRLSGGRRGVANMDLSPEVEAAFPIRMAILLGEVSGSKQALNRLDRKMPRDKASDAELLRTLYSKGPEALDGRQRRHLQKQYGWFGQLALTHGLPADNPQRKAVVHPAVVAAEAVIGAVVIGGLMLVIGLVLLVLAIIFILGGTLRRRYQPTDPFTAAFLEGFAIYLGGMGLLLLGLERYWPAMPPPLRWAIYFGLPLAVFWPLLRGVSWTQWRQGLGWHRGNGFFHEIGAGVTGYVAAAPLMLIGVMVSAALMSATGQQSTHPIIQQAGDSGLHLLGLYLLACVWAPLAEESLFRGALYTHMRQGWGWIVSALVVAFIFAIIHPQGWVALPVLGTFAFASASIREWRGSLIGCMTAHAINNAIAVTLLVLVLR
jgi:membrane protease YdiL (CAAX protease family)